MSEEIRPQHLSNTSGPVPMTKMMGADIVLECLKRVGIDTVFGYPGGVVLPLYDRWPSHPGRPPTPGRDARRAVPPGGR